MDIWDFREELREAIRLENLGEIFEQETERMMNEIIKMFREDFQYKLPLPEGEELLFFIKGSQVYLQEKYPRGIEYSGGAFLSYSGFYQIGIAVSSAISEIDIEIEQLYHDNLVVSKTFEFSDDVFKNRRSNYSFGMPLEDKCPQAYQEKWIFDYLPKFFSEDGGFQKKFVGIDSCNAPIIVFKVPQEFVTE